MFLKKRLVNGAYYWSIAKSYRDKGKPRQHIIQNLGTTEKAVSILENNQEYGQFLDEILLFALSPYNKTSPILKYPGAKWNLSQWIINFFPPHKVYMEPYFGSGAVLFNKRPSKIETINDMDGNVVNLFKVIRENPMKLAEIIEMTPWARDEYYKSYELSGDSLEDARRFLVRCWQAFGTKTCNRTGWRHSAAKNAPNMPAQWIKVPERITATANRLKKVQIDNMPAIDLIKKYNQEETLIYADPPYLLSTRSGKMYKHEMSEEDHVELIKTLLNHKGSVILSGYDNDIYNELLKGWKKESVKTTAEQEHKE